MPKNRAAANQSLTATNSTSPRDGGKTEQEKSVPQPLLTLRAISFLLFVGLYGCSVMPLLPPMVTENEGRLTSKNTPPTSHPLSNTVASAQPAGQTLLPKPLYMTNYASVEDFPTLAGYGINTLLIDLEADGSDWVTTYETAIQHNLRLIPLIWGIDQTIWVWNQSAQEWELNQNRYPNSTGAQFLAFLKANPRYLAQTFAIYGFHEPLNSEVGFVSCSQMAKFYQQITQEEFPNEQLFVYSEDLVLGWPDSENCRSGIQDYEVHTLYPFCTSTRGKYRPFNVEENWYYDPTNDLDFTLQAELAHLDERLRVLAEAAPAPGTGRRPKVVVLIQTFSAQVDEPELWNRMPSAEEMHQFAEYVLSQRGDRIGGLAWYPFELVATNYTAALKTHRYDPSGADRWAVMGEIGQRFFSGTEHRVYLPMVRR